MLHRVALALHSVLITEDRGHVRLRCYLPTVCMYLLTLVFFWSLGKLDAVVEVLSMEGSMSSECE